MAKDLELPKPERRLPLQVLTADEVESTMNQTDVQRPMGLRDRAILETFYSTGIRASELANLQLYDLDADRKVLIIRQGKGKKDRVVPIGERAIRWLQKYMADVRPALVEQTQPHPTLFVTAQGTPISRSLLACLVKRYMRKAGIRKPGSCHLLRHTAATLMMENGADLRSLQLFLGHACLKTTQLYTHVSIQRLQEVHRKTHPASSPPPASDANDWMRTTTSRYNQRMRWAAPTILETSSPPLAPSAREAATGPRVVEPDQRASRVPPAAQDAGNCRAKPVSSCGKPLGFTKDPYGQVTVLDADFTADADNVSDYDNSYLYTGRRLDTETGLYFYRARYYHPGLGRFVSRDPIGYIDGANMYRYAASNPIVFADPWGTLTIEVATKVDANHQPLFQPIRPGNIRAMVEDMPAFYYETGTVTRVAIEAGAGGITHPFFRIIGECRCENDVWRIKDLKLQVGFAITISPSDNRLNTYGHEQRHVVKILQALHSQTGAIAAMAARKVENRTFPSEPACQAFLETVKADPETIRNIKAAIMNGVNHRPKNDNRESDWNMHPREATGEDALPQKRGDTVFSRGHERRKTWLINQRFHLFSWDELKGKK